VVFNSSSQLTLFVAIQMTEELYGVYCTLIAQFYMDGYPRVTDFVLKVFL